MPTAVVCSDEFGPLGRAESQVLGQGGLPLIAIPHPLADNGPSLVEAKASIIVGEIELALLGDAEEVSDRHRHHFVRLTERRLDRGALCLDDACAIDVALAPTAPGAVPRSRSFP